MKKSIITIVAFMLFALAGFAQGGEMMYIRTYLAISGAVPMKVYVWRNGTTTKIDFKTSIAAGREENEINNTTEFANLLSAYIKEGYELKSVTNLGGDTRTIIEYILKKQ